MSDKNQIKLNNSTASRWIIFLITLSLVFISLISVVFPALIVRTVSPVDYSPVNAWETGPMAFSLILTNVIILGIGLVYYKNKLPLIITKVIKFIFNFEVSKKIALIVLVIFFSIYIAASFSELGETEKGFDGPRVVEKAENWNIEKFFKNFNVPFRFLYLSSSIDLFENIRVIPFIGSIALVVLTYFITLEFSQKRFAGLVAVSILLQSYIFLKFDTRSTYDNFWTLFYLLSLYFVFKAWPLSTVSFVLSALSKQFIAVFLPFTLFFIYRAKISKDKKIYLLISYFVLIGLGIVVLAISDITILRNLTEFSGFDFWQGFTSTAFSLRFDYLVVLFLLPLTVGLFIASKRGVPHADLILILITGVLITAPLLTGFTNLTNQPYRFIPLVVFFAIGVGTILSKRIENTSRLDS